MCCLLGAICITIMQTYGNYDVIKCKNLIPSSHTNTLETWKFTKVDVVQQHLLYNYVVLEFKTLLILIKHSAL